MCISIVPSALNIQFRFNGVPDCGQYTLLDPNLKTHDVTTGLVQGVESLCGCGFNTAFISSPSLQCFDDSPQHVTYRAVLTETNNATTVQIVSYIKQWTASTQSLVVQSVRLGINTTCPTVIIDFNSPECPQATSPPPTNPLPGDIGGIIGGVVAGVFVLVVIVAAVIVIVLVGVRHRKTGSKDVQNNTRKLVFSLTLCIHAYYSINRSMYYAYISHEHYRTILYVQMYHQCLCGHTCLQCMCNGLSSGHLLICTSVTPMLQV